MTCSRIGAEPGAPRLPARSLCAIGTRTATTIATVASHPVHTAIVSSLSLYRDMSNAPPAQVPRPRPSFAGACSLMRSFPGTRAEHPTNEERAHLLDELA